MNGLDGVLKIKLTVAQHFGLSAQCFETARRPQYIAWPRQIAMALVRERTNLSLNEIGQLFGRRDHGTVLHAERRVSERCAIDERDRLVVQLMRQRLDMPEAPTPPPCPIPDA